MRIYLEDIPSMSTKDLIIAKEKLKTKLYKDLYRVFRTDSVVPSLIVLLNEVRLELAKRVERGERVYD